MTAEEARKLVNQAEGVDNSDTVLAHIQAASKRREHSIRVSSETMTRATMATLKKLGYSVQPHYSKKGWGHFYQGGKRDGWVVI